MIHYVPTLSTQTIRAMSGAPSSAWSMLHALSVSIRVDGGLTWGQMYDLVGVRPRTGRDGRAWLVEHGIVYQTAHGWALRGESSPPGEIPPPGEGSPKNRRATATGGDSPPAGHRRKTGGPPPPSPYTRVKEQRRRDPSSVTGEVDPPAREPTPSSEEEGSEISQSMVGACDLSGDVLELRFRARPSEHIRSRLTAAGWTYQADEQAWTAQRTASAYAALHGLAPWLPTYQRLECDRVCRDRGLADTDAAALDDYVDNLRRQRVPTPQRGERVTEWLAARVDEATGRDEPTAELPAVETGDTLAPLDGVEPPDWWDDLRRRASEAGLLDRIAAVGAVRLAGVDTSTVTLCAQDERTALVVSRSYRLALDAMASDVGADPVPLDWQVVDGRERGAA